MTPEEERHLLATVTKTGTKMDALISDDHTDGLVPELQGKVEKHSDQINFWRGALALLAFLIVVIGGAFIAHIWK